MENNYFFLENYVTSEGAISHNVLYHQPLPITRYQVRFYADNYFEQLPIVSTAFKGLKMWCKTIGLSFCNKYIPWHFLAGKIHVVVMEILHYVS